MQSSNMFRVRVHLRLVAVPCAEEYLYKRCHVCYSQETSLVQVHCELGGPTELTTNCQKRKYPVAQLRRC